MMYTEFCDGRLIDFYFYFYDEDEGAGNAEGNAFEQIKRISDEGIEHWSARELSKVLEYQDYRNFQLVLDKAMQACHNSGQSISDHFGEATNMIKIGKGGQRPIEDYALSRYACYLVVQNADPSKEVVALGQTYFAVQTRRQEIADDQKNLTEDELRLAIRAELRRHNLQLADAAHDSGVIESVDYAIFQNHGYQGLYGGLGRKEIHSRKGLKKSQQILDHMGSTELAANLFRATQTDEKLRREGIKGKQQAYSAHHEVGLKVRLTIKELGGTMPEDLPTPDKSIRQIEKEQQKRVGPKDKP